MKASLINCDTILWQRYVSTLAQVMVCCLMASNHYLDQCWLLISNATWHSHESNFTVSVQAPILCSEFEKHTLKLSTHLPGANELIVNVGHRGVHYTINWIHDGGFGKGTRSQEGWVQLRLVQEKQGIKLARLCWVQNGILMVMSNSF